MKRTALFLLLIATLAGCGRIQENDKPEAPVITESADSIEELLSPTPPPTVISEADGNLHFDLSSTSTILIRSAPVGDGIIIADKAMVRDITDMMTNFSPHSQSDNFIPSQEYTLVFYDEAGSELVSVAAYENFVISYLGNLYYNDDEQLYIEKIRRVYLDEVKKTFTCSNTSFNVNGKEYNLQEEFDPSINAITKYTWIGFDEYPEAAIIFECHINPNVGFCAIFDVEKMDFIFSNYGTSFTYYPFSETSLIYAFQDNVYNYWGDILYQNKDDKYYIYSLEYSPDESDVIITLSHKQEEKLLQVNRLNYHKPDSFFIEYCTDNNIIPERIPEFQADLTHDGINENLSVSKIDLGSDYAYFQVTDNAGNVLWSEEAHASHAGWNSVFHCRMDGEDYLLIFNPYMSTGYATYMYALFYITGPNRIHIIDSGTYSFSDNAKVGTEGAFSEDTFRPFIDKVNKYLHDSNLLMSTESGTLIYSTKDHILSVEKEYEADQWITDIVSILTPSADPE